MAMHITDKARRGVVLSFFTVLALTLAGRAVYLQVFDYEFLRGQAEARQNRMIEIPAHRGSIFDRNGAPLAVSTPIDSIWGVPSEMLQSQDKWTELAAILDTDIDRMTARIESAVSRKKAFMYLRRHVNPEVSGRIAELSVDGVNTMREYARYYPSRKASAHVVGFTDVDDNGSEGLELAYDQNWLKGKSGKRRVVRDLLKREIESLEIKSQAKPGKNLYLSIDKRLQYLAIRALEKAVEEHKARSASLVAMDVRTGEVLAMVNVPTYNPNDKSQRRGGKKRNRAVTDLFEPGSTIKPITMAAALESGKFSPDDIVYTSPGWRRVGRYEIKDSRDYGWLDLRGVIKKSSNVGITKIAEQLDPEQMWSVFDLFGFGRPPGTEFPGEAAGSLNHPSVWNNVEQVSLSYGYGLSSSALQLVRAYSAIANRGVMPQISFVRRDSADLGIRVLSEKVALQVGEMMESVISKEGTGWRARVPGYRVAGKTGTSYKSSSGGYDEKRYISLFAGFAPVSDPRLALVVVIHDPSAGQHYGGHVAAPVFSRVMGEALRLMDVKLDDWSSLSANMRSEIEVGRLN